MYTFRLAQSKNLSAAMYTLCTLIRFASDKSFSALTAASQKCTGVRAVWLFPLWRFPAAFPVPPGGCCRTAGAPIDRA